MTSHGDPAEPTLLLLHGYGDDGGCWPTQVARWSGDWYVVTPDARGHGASPRWTDADLDAGVAEVMVDDVVAVLESAAATTAQPQAVLVGHSMGAAVAACVAAARPDLVRGLVLEDPPWFADWRDRQGPDPAKAAERSAALRETAALTYHERLRQVRAENPAWTDEECVAWAAGKGDPDLALAADARAGGFQVTPWPDVVAGLGSHRVPTLVVGGHTGDALVTAEVATDVEAIGGAAVHVELLEGAGHSVRRDRREDFHGLVDPWLAALRPGARPAR